MAEVARDNETDRASAPEEPVGGQPGDAGATVSSGTTAPPRPVTRWQNFSFALVQATVSMLRRCLSLSGLYVVGQCFGTLEWLTNYRRRRRFVVELERILGHKPSAAQRRLHTRAFFMRMRCNKLYYFVFDKTPEALLRSRFSIIHRERLDEALARGRGVLLAVSHHGDVQIMIRQLRLCGYPVRMVRDRNEGAVRRWVHANVDRRHPDELPLTPMYADVEPREVVEALKRRVVAFYASGGVLISAMDVGRIRSKHHKMEHVRYLGEDRPFLTGPVRLALRCGAPVLLGLAVDEKGYRYDLDIAATLLDPDQVADEKEAVSAAVHEYARILDRHVRARPSLLSRI